MALGLMGLTAAMVPSLTAAGAMGAIGAGALGTSSILGATALGSTGSAILGSMAPAALSPAMAPMYGSPAWLPGLSAGQGFSSMGGQYGAAPSASSLLGQTPGTPVSWLDKTMGALNSPMGQNALGMGLGALAGGLANQPFMPGQGYVPYPPKSEYEEQLAGQYTEDAVTRLQDAFNREADLAKFGVENLRANILPFIFDADPNKDALQNFLVGSRTEFDTLKDLKGRAFRHVDEQLMPFMEGRRGFMSDIEARMLGLHPRLEAAAEDPFALSPTAAATIGEIEAAGRARLLSLEEIEREKIMEKAYNVFGPSADINAYTTQMFSPFARETALARAQQEQAYAQQRLGAGISATGELRSIYNLLGSERARNAADFLSAGQQIGTTFAPVQQAQAGILGMRENLFKQGLDIKRDFASRTANLSGRYDPLQFASALGGIRRSDVEPLAPPQLQPAKPSLGSDIAALGSQLAFQEASRGHKEVAQSKMFKDLSDYYRQTAGGYGKNTHLY